MRSSPSRRAFEHAEPLVLVFVAGAVHIAEGELPHGEERPPARSPHITHRSSQRRRPDTSSGVSTSAGRSNRPQSAEMTLALCTGGQADQIDRIPAVFHRGADRLKVWVLPEQL